IVADVNAGNAAELLGGTDVLLDGTDNFETRYLLNDVSILKGIPWIYGAAVGSYGASMTIVPGEGPCLACIFPSPPAGLQPTCDTDGILSATASAVASIQIAECLKLLADRGALHGKLIIFDLWENRFQALNPGPAAASCRACQMRQFASLSANGCGTVRLCGRNSVQVSERSELNLAELERRLAPHGTVRRNAYVLRFLAAPYEMTVFPDGRAIIKGTDDPEQARRL